MHLIISGFDTSELYKSALFQAILRHFQINHCLYIGHKLQESFVKLFLLSDLPVFLF